MTPSRVAVSEIDLEDDMASVADTGRIGSDANWLKGAAGHYALLSIEARVDAAALDHSLSITAR